jgi:hypothetical protein
MIQQILIYAAYLCGIAAFGYVAHRRGHNGFYWGLLALLITPLFAWPLLKRRPE